MTSVASFELTLPSPAENLACDEALLDLAEAGSGGAWLRFWEPSQHFVVLGYANCVRDEVHLDACRDAGVPILRRCSGGGTVLQGPGCLNYSLILPLADPGTLSTITGANRYIMEQHRRALAMLLGKKVAVEGHTDLAIGNRKFSGNAQRRRRRYLLFHGCFLIELDLALLSRCLSMPARQPEYRRARTHADFLTTVDVSRAALKAALASAWNAQPSSFSPPADHIQTLVTNKYSCETWNLRMAGNAAAP
jgi:lipoate-protein ligase A